MKLTDVKLRALAAARKPLGKHFDGHGLYLEVTATGGPYWRMKYRFGGKEKRLAFGVYPEVTLKAARERQAAARQVLAAGQDPAAVRRVEQASAALEQATTFGKVAREWLAHQAAGWSERTARAIQASLETHVFPKLEAVPMAQIRPREVMAIVKAIEQGGAVETAGRVLQRVQAVFRFAVQHERIERNPMLDLKPSELLKPRRVQHRAALQVRELPAFLASLAAYQGEPTTVIGLRLLMLTALRPGELRGGCWDEVDEAAATWRVPAARMKMKAPHIVPLSRQALALIAELRAHTGAGPLMFPSPFYPAKTISENTFNSALARLGYKGEHSAHGFRALFSTVANESGHDADVIERQLAHVERNEVRAAYHRAEYLPQRRELLQWWADHIETIERAHAAQ